MNELMRERVRLKNIPSVGRAVDGWPTKSRHVVERLTKIYGSPHEATAHMVVWYYNSPWKSTFVYRDGVPHNFPKPHLDVIKQTIDYQVPVDKIDALVAFNGSLMVDQTAGELSACCASEELNMLLLNLAHDIVIGRRTVEEARRRVVFSQRMHAMNWPDDYRESLGFYHEAWWSRRPTQEPQRLWGRMLASAKEKVA